MTALNETPHAEALPHESGASSLIDGHYAPPPADGDGKSWVRTSVIVQAEPQRLYELWRDVEAAPKWHERTLEVRKTGPATYHWLMRDEPGDHTMEWDFEIVSDQPGKRIAWRSVKGNPESAGEVVFEQASGGRGTMVTVLQQLRIGTFARVWETITGRDPKQSVIEDLRHFKAFAETGEIPRTEPQPHGGRGAAARMKRSMYGENIQVPPGDEVNQPGQKGSSAK